MADEELRKYYHGGAHPDAEAHKLVGQFLPDKVMAQADDEGEIKPMDYVILTESGPDFVGNHPRIELAFKENVAGRVIAREAEIVIGNVKAVLEKYTGKTVESCMVYHVVFFPDQEKPFLFYEPFVRKVVVSDGQIILS